MRRSLFFVALVGGVGCGLTFSPGDYSAPGENGPDATTSPEASLTVDGATTETSTSNEAGPAAPAQHVILFSGTKENNVDTNDVWTAPVAANGDLGPFTYMQSTPIVKPLQAVALVNGKLFTVTQGATTRVAQITDFDGGATSAWTTAPIPNPPPTSYGSFFAKTSAVVIGGQTSETVDDGQGGTTTVVTTHGELLVNKATANQYPAPNNVASATKLPVGLFAVTAVTYKDFVYVWGLSDDKDQASTVFVGKADETLGLASATPTAPITDPDGGKPHAPTTPIACAGEGRLFVIGGGGAETKTLSADITEATGALGTWKAGPNLPIARSAGACAVVQGSLYVFGGRLGTGAPTSELNKPTAQILRSRISAGGGMTEWEITAQTLIGPRANVFALTY